MIATSHLKLLLIVSTVIVFADSKSLLNLSGNNFKTEKNENVVDISEEVDRLKDTIDTAKSMKIIDFDRPLEVHDQQVNPFRSRDKVKLDSLKSDKFKRSPSNTAATCKPWDDDDEEGE